MFTRFICSSSLVLMALSTTHAADVVAAQKPAAASTFSWAGFYAGVQAGWMKAKQSDQQKGEWGYGPLYFDGPFEKNTQRDDLFNGGLYAGYNFIFGEHWLVGADADITFINSNSAQNEYYEEYDYQDQMHQFVTIEDDKQKVRFRNAAAVRGRLGYVYERTMIYLAGGFATTKASIDVSNEISFKSYFWGDTREENYQASGSESASLNGGTIGAGIEYALTDHVIFRSEYRYTDFGSKEIKITSSDFYEAPNYKLDYKTHDVRVGLAYKFN